MQPETRAVMMIQLIVCYQFNWKREYFETQAVCCGEKIKAFVQTSDEKCTICSNIHGHVRPKDDMNITNLSPSLRWRGPFFD